MKFEKLANSIKSINDKAGSTAKSAVNQLMTLRNWAIGYYIVEYEQAGSDRAEYGTQLLKNLEKEISQKGRFKYMKILIIGLARTGEGIIRAILDENHDVTVIDTNSERVRRIAEEYDVMGLCANGISISSLTEADVENTDILIAVTESDEVNLLCALMAKKVAK